jgi:hypothetical protein
MARGITSPKWACSSWRCSAPSRSPRWAQSDLDARERHTRRQGGREGAVDRGLNLSEHGEEAYFGEQGATPAAGVALGEGVIVSAGAVGPPKPAAA